MDFYQNAFYLVMNADLKTGKLILPPQKRKAEAVRLANYLRQQGLKCEVKGQLNICYWVEVKI